jgi:hypothetical protein
MCKDICSKFVSNVPATSPNSHWATPVSRTLLHHFDSKRVFIKLFSGIIRNDQKSVRYANTGALLLSPGSKCDLLHHNNLVAFSPT